MNKVEMKKMLPIIQAYVDGKVVEYQEAETGEWKAIEDYEFLITNDDKPRYYRIKPEPKYRPFKNADECWNEMLKHQPFGWVKGPFGEYAVIDFIDASGTARHGNVTWSFKKSFDNIAFADGAPFGIKEGGEE